jgi:hypothetical protein
VKYPLLLSDFNENLNEFTRQTFEQSSNIKFNENPSTRSRIVQCARKDRHDVHISRFSKFFERASKVSKMYFFIVSDFN